MTVMTDSSPPVPVRFNGIHKAYGRQTVLDGIDLIVQQGEYLGLIGVNGAGKTTLIKCLLDLAAVDAGQISLFGKDHRHTDARGHLAYLPEKFIPPYYLTGHDFLAFVTGMQGVRYTPEECEAVLAGVDLRPEFLDKPVRQLSKGMSQKLGLAACLLCNRPLLLLDEPMSGLDPRARASLKRYLLALKQRGTTLFFSTHLLTDVEALCDRVAILHNGRIRYTGSPAECCREFGTADFESAYLACVAGEADRQAHRTE